jgi:hypothetical protein
MKKPLIAFVVLFALAFGVVVSGEINKLDTEAAIAKAPVFVLAEPAGITKKTKKGRESYQVNYTYTVAGTSYPMDTAFMSTEAEALAMAASPVQIVYAANTPAVAEFKSDFDSRDPKAGMGGALLTAAGLGLLLAIIGTLVLMWKFPWFRRA